MTGHGDVLATVALLIAVIMVVTWIVSLVLMDASIVDIVWGTGFAAVAALSAWLGDGDADRRLLLLLLVGLWGVRLAAHLWWRNHGRGEDRFFLV